MVDGWPRHLLSPHVMAHVRGGGVEADVHHLGVGARLAQRIAGAAQDRYEGMAGSAPAGAEVQRDDVRFAGPALADEARALGPHEMERDGLAQRGPRGGWMRLPCAPGGS